MATELPSLPLDFAGRSLLGRCLGPLSAKSRVTFGRIPMGGFLNGGVSRRDAFQGTSMRLATSSGSSRIPMGGFLNGGSPDETRFKELR